MEFWIIAGGVVVVIVIIVALAMKSRRPAKADNPDVYDLFPNLKAAPAADAKAEAALRQNLRVKLQHQEDKIDAAIDFERQRNPAAPTAELMRAAIERWRRDNR